jgi:hypothetical protein
MDAVSSYITVTCDRRVQDFEAKPVRRCCKSLQIKEIARPSKNGGRRKFLYCSNLWQACTGFMGKTCTSLL